MGLHICPPTRLIVGYHETEDDAQRRAQRGRVGSGTSDIEKCGLCLSDTRHSDC